MSGIRNSSSSKWRQIAEFNHCDEEFALNWKLYLITLITVLVIPGAALAEKEPGGFRTDVMMIDDWPADALMSMGSLRCPGGELEWLNR
jgi:hypothetical protein